MPIHHLDTLSSKTFNLAHHEDCHSPCLLLKEVPFKESGEAF